MENTPIREISANLPPENSHTKETIDGADSTELADLREICAGTDATTKDTVRIPRQAKNIAAEDMRQFLCGLAIECADLVERVINKINDENNEDPLIHIRDFYLKEFKIMCDIAENTFGKQRLLDKVKECHGYLTDLKCKYFESTAIEDIELALGILEELDDKLTNDNSLQG